MKNVATHPNQQKLWQTLLLMIGTAGLYEFYWFYKSWGKLYAANHEKATPWIRTLMLFIPIVGSLMVWELFYDIKKFCKRNGIPTFEWPGLLTIAYLVGCGISIQGSYLGGLIICTLVILRVQKTVNDYWGHAMHEKA